MQQALLLIDEEAGRRVARSLGLNVRGSLGVLISEWREGSKKMLAVRALYHDGKLEWLEPPPEDAQGMVAVVFLEAEQAQDADTREADMLAASPNFRRLMERSMAYLADEETRPVQALLDELPVGA